MNISLPVLLLTAIIALPISSGIEIDQALHPILSQCDIHILSHRCPKNVEFQPFSLNSVDQDLEDLAMSKFTSAGLPHRFTLLSCNTSFVGLYNSISRRNGSRCEAAIWFLKPYVANGNSLIDSRFTWVSYTVNSARDFAIVIFREQLTPKYVTKLNTMTEVQLENTMFVTINWNTSDVISIGVVRRHCDETGLTCIDLQPLNPTTSPQSLATKDYFRQLAPRSTYATSFKYNLNRMTLNLSLGVEITEDDFEFMAKVARVVGLRGIMVGPSHSAKFSDYIQPHQSQRYTAIFSSNNMIHKYFKMVGAVELIENFFNVSVRPYTQQHKPLEPALYPFVSNHRDLLPASYDQSVAGIHHHHLACVNKGSNQIDILSFFNPLDKWIWLCSLTSYVLLGLLFRSQTRSSFFMLLAPVLEQDSCISVKRLSFLVLIWSFACFLLSNLFSGMIGSFLVVPPANPFVDDFKQLYEEGYKIFFSARPDENHIDFRKLLSLVALGDSVNSTALRQRYKYLLKLEEEMEILDPAATDADTFDKQIEHGKGCTAIHDLSQGVFSSIVAQVYPDYVGFVMKKNLGQYVDSWLFAGPYQAPLYRSFSTFVSTGVTNIYLSSSAFLSGYLRQTTLGVLMRRKDPHHIETRFYSVGRVEIPYLMSLKDEQSKLVFYAWMGLNALASVVFLTGHSVKWWKAFRRGSEAKIDVSQLGKA